jgi:hypothetical protein
MSIVFSLCVVQFSLARVEYSSAPMAAGTFDFREIQGQQIHLIRLEKAIKVLYQRPNKLNLQPTSVFSGGCAACARLNIQHAPEQSQVPKFYCKLPTYASTNSTPLWTLWPIVSVLFLCPGLLSPLGI